MQKLIIASVSSLAVGFAAASLLQRETPAPVPSNAGRGTPFDASAPVEQRIRALEQAVSEERQARQLLQEELLVLTDELERLAPQPPEDPVQALVEPDAAAEAETRQRREDYRERNSADGRIARLIEAGFQPGDAERIVRRESELQMAALQARYEAQRSGEPIDFMQSRSAATNQLRAELGDEQYERYLEANGRATSIAVSAVMESSPAQRAGLQPGDKIVRYDGARLFSMSDLSAQTMQGDAGVNVVVDIERDGIPMQVVLPRGPLGISAGRRYSR